MILQTKFVLISTCVLVIKLLCVLGVEVKSTNDTDEKRIIRPTGYIYRQFSNHQPEIIYFNDQTTYKVETSDELKPTTQSSKILKKSRISSESNESNELTSKESNDSNESSSSGESVETSASPESSSKVHHDKPNTDQFRKTAKEYFDHKKSKTKPHRTTESPQPSKSFAPKKPHKGGGYETYEPQSEEQLTQRPIYQQRPPYGFVHQTPPTKGMASNHRPRHNAPIIFGNPFNFRWPVYRKIHVIPVPRKPPPKQPPVNKPKMKPQPPKEHQPPEKHEPPTKHDNPEKHEPPKKHDEKPEEETEQKEKKEKKQQRESESEEEENYEKDSLNSGGEKESDESQQSTNYSEHESHEKKMRKQFKDKNGTQENGGRRGHKSSKKDDKSGHNSNESGFHKVSGVKFNNENRKRKGFKTDKGYKNLDTFGKGKKKDYDEEHHSDSYEKNHDKKTTASDASKKYGNHHDGYRGDKGGKFNEHKFHKKGAKTTGYHNTFHKDEYKKVHTFYDDADHKGNFKKYGSQHEQFDSNNGSAEDNSDEDENWSSKHSQNKGYSEKEEYSNYNGHKKQNKKGYRWK